MNTSPRNTASTPQVHQDRFGRFQVITETGSSWSPDPPSVRQLHEARARELQREAVDLVLRQAGAWLRRAAASCLPRPAAPVPPTPFTLQRRT